MIKYSEGNGIVRINGIHYRDEKKKDIPIPKLAIGVFSRYLFNDIIEKFQALEIGYISCANYESNIYIVRYNDVEFVLFMAHVSSCRISDDIEQLRVSGVKTFIVYGNCGVLDKNIEDCSIIIPTLGYREEGTGFHYVPESETIEMNPKYQNLFIKLLEEKGFNYTLGYTWTTDAPYRETREKINYFKEKGCICVEMEGTCIAAVCKYYNLDYFTFYYAGDNLDSVEWEERSISGLANIDIKKEVTYLALDLAVSILKK